MQCFHTADKLGSYQHPEALQQSILKGEIFIELRTSDFSPLVMSWRAKLPVLLLLASLIIACCRAERQCHGALWSEPKAVFVGDTFEVFCRCNSSQVRLQDMHLKPSHLVGEWETTPVDEYTVVHREKVVQGRKFFRMYCEHGDEYVGELYVKVVPLLNVNGLECRMHSPDKDATCFFKELGFAASIPKKSYSLSVNGLASIPCWKVAEESSWIECRGLYIPRGSESDYQMQLSMEYEGHNQTQVFPPIALRQMMVPEWPSSQPHIYPNSSRVCVKWAHTDLKSFMAIAQNWEVEIRSRNPRIKPQVTQIRVVPMFFQDLCFPQLPFANQVYSFRFRRRYNVPDAPWSFAFDSNEFTSVGALPARPPVLLPNGFYHDPERKELYVFWWQLDELELNGPNFTYAAVTSTGKNASSITNNCAVFSDWNNAASAMIYVWSRNSLGSSTTSNALEVPLLTSSRSQQARELRYHDDNYTLSWQAPQEQQGLNGYAISWCSGSTNRSQICDDHEYIYLQMVNGSQLQFQFNRSMVLSNVAVAATYQDRPSGGMKWIGPKFPTVLEEGEKSPGLSLSQVIAAVVVVVALLALTFASVRKLQRMAKIEVSLPEILFKSMDMEISAPDPSSPIVITVPGNFPPKGALTIDILSRGGSVEEEVALAPPDSEYISGPSTSASVSPSLSTKELTYEAKPSPPGEELAYEARPATKKEPSPYIPVPSGYVMSPSPPREELAFESRPATKMEPSPYVPAPSGYVMSPSPPGEELAYETRPGVRKEPSPYVPAPSGYVMSPSPPGEELAYETRPGVKKEPSPYVPAPSGYVMSPI